MPEYLVTWQIDVEADDAHEAALQAEMIMADPTRMGNIFEVQDRELGGDTVMIELTGGADS